MFCLNRPAQRILLPILNFRVPCVREVNHRCSYELTRIVLFTGINTVLQNEFRTFYRRLQHNGLWRR